MTAAPEFRHLPAVDHPTRSEIMSTERKPGSRGVKAPQGPLSETPLSHGAVGGGSKRKLKGSTRTVSRRQSFKRKPK